MNTADTGTRRAMAVVYEFEDFTLDGERLELFRAGQPVRCDLMVVRALCCLVRHAGELVTKETLIEEVWEGRAVADNVISVAMARLRKLLGHRRQTREIIINVYGRGYRFLPSVRQRATVTLPPPPQQSGVDGPPLVGRGRVLERLHDAWQQTQAGSGRICLLMGEAGIGKTHVAECFERSLQGSGARVAWGYCREAGDTPPLWPWLRLYREVTGEHWQSELMLPQADASTAARVRVFDGMVRALAQQGPWVLVLDDLHRADAATLDLTRHLLDEISRSSLLLIATLRDGKLPSQARSPLNAVLSHRNSERISLPRLSEGEVAQYLSRRIEDADGRWARAVFAKSEGNPFFMAELVRQIDDTEQPDPSRLEFSGAALDLLRQRIAQLDAQAYHALSVAAVIGRSFELGVLQAATGIEAPVLMGHLDDALESELLVADPESATAFAFRHELLRTALYEDLPAAEQRRWHLRVARVLDERLRRGEAIPQSELAYHFHAALPDSDLRQTVHYCRAAITAAAAAFSHRDVVRHTRQAFEALDLMENPSVRLRMSMLYFASLYARADDPEAAIAMTQELTRLAKQQGDGGMLVFAATMFNPFPGLPPLPGSSDALQHALAHLQPEAIGLRAVALATLACAAPHAYTKATCHDLLDQARRVLQQSPSRAARYTTATYALYLLGGPDHPAQAAHFSETLEQLVQAHGSRFPVAPVYLALHRTVTALQQGDPHGLEQALARLEAAAHKIQNMELIWHTQRMRAMLRIQRGELEAGGEALRSLHRHAEEEQILGTAPFCAFDRVVVLEEHKSDQPAPRALLDALQYRSFEPPSIWSMKVHALAALGDEEPARAALHAVSADQLNELPCDRDYLGTLGHLARAALYLGETPYMQALYELLSRYPDAYCGHVSFLGEGAVPQVLGMLARGLGRHELAAEHFEVALASNRKAGLTLHATETERLLAACRRSAR